MSRRQQALGGSYLKNPSELYLEWASDDKAFRYYNKETKQNELLKLPLKFVYVDERQTVGGWNDKNKSALYANEVKYIGTEPFTVKLNKGNELIVKGLYKDIKETIVANGGHYVRSVYVIVDGKPVNIKFKGSGTQVWGDFAQREKSKFLNNYIEVNTVSEMKKGKVNYSVPVFSIGAEIEDQAKIDEICDVVFDYLEQKKVAGAEPTGTEEDIYASVEEQTASRITGSNEDDLPF
jgi:hypothetical protein